MTRSPSRRRGADFVGMGMPTYEKPGHPVGRQSFAADEGGKRPGNPCRIVGMGMPTYEKPGHPVGRQSVAADEGGKMLGNPCRIETFAEHLFLFTLKEGEKCNRMNILNISMIPF